MPGKPACRVRKLSTVAPKLPIQVLVSVIRYKRRENYAAVRPDGFFTLHYQVEKAKEAAAGNGYPLIVALRE